MASNVRLREQGIIVNSDRYQFTRAHVQAKEDLTVGGNVFVANDALIESLIVSSPGAIKILGASQDENIYQVVKIPDGSVPSLTPFLCAATGFVSRISTCWPITPGDTKTVDLTLANTDFQDEDNEFTTGSSVAGIESTQVWTIEGNRNAELLATFTKGALRFLRLSKPSASMAAVALNVIIEISPTA